MLFKLIVILALLASPVLSLPKPKPLSDEKHLEPKTDELKAKLPNVETPAVKKLDEADSKLDAKVDEPSKIRVEPPKSDIRKEADKATEQLSTNKTNEEPKLEQQKGQQQQIGSEDELPAKIEQSKLEQQKQEPQQLEEPIKQQQQIEAQPKPEAPIKEDNSTNKVEQQLKGEHKQQQQELKEEDNQEQQQQFEEQQQEQVQIEEPKPLPAKKGLTTGKGNLEQQSKITTQPRPLFQQELIQAHNTFQNKKQALKARIFGTYQTTPASIYVESGKQMQQQPQPEQQQQQIIQQSQTPYMYTPYLTHYQYPYHNRFGYQGSHEYYSRPSVFSRWFGGSYIRPHYGGMMYPGPRYY